MALLFNNAFVKRIFLWVGIIATVFCLQLLPASAQKTKAQADSLKKIKPVVIRDSAYLADSVKKHAIRKATIHSAIIPGWGQINNKQVWKVPLVYAALGIPAYLFFDNLESYKVLRDTYIYMTDDDPANDNLIPDNLKPLSENSIKYYRDQYRRNVDYSALAFLIAWGLNVVDATVFANLRDFDVSDKISLRIDPRMDPIRKSAGIGLVFRQSASSQKKVSTIITR